MIEFDDRYKLYEITNEVADNLPDANPKLIQLVQRKENEKLEIYVQSSNETDLDLDEKDWKNRTALHYAAIVGNLEAVCLLVEEGAEIDVLSDDYWTPLLYGARYGHVEIVKYLLAQGADYTWKTKLQEFNSLDWAKMGGHEKIVDVLLVYGADSNHFDFTERRKQLVEAKCMEAP